MKSYTFENVTYTKLPDPCNGVSPMTEQRFKDMGGVINDDGEPSPEQRVCEEFTDLIEDLASKTDKITPEEFLQAAANGISADLIDFARERGVSEAVIAEGRTRIVEILEDAHRFGMYWTDLIAGVIPQA